VLCVRGAVLACPLADPDAAERSVLDNLARGRFDKAQRKLASMRLESAPHPGLPVLEALAELAEGKDPAGERILPLLDPAVPAHAQVRAELAALRGDPCRAVVLYGEVPPAFLDGLQLRPRIAALEEACLGAFAARTEALWAAGDFAGMEAALQALPPRLAGDARAAWAAFPAAVLAGDAVRARALLDRLPAADRDRCAVMVSAMELDPSLRLSYLKQAGNLLSNDPLGQAVVARALDEWLVGNMPPEFRRAWESPALAQRDLALLLCLHFPGLKGGAVPGAELPAAVLKDPQADCLAPLCSQGFLPGYAPDEPVPADAAVRALSRALESVGLVDPCGQGREAWVRCGLLPEAWGEGPLSGRQWSALAHRALGDLP
jgi:hypothetical protein